MKLTAKQEAFAQAVAGGMKQADAYRAAYSAGGMKPETVQNSAYKLLLNGEVAARVERLKLALAAKGEWTRERSVKALAKIVDDADSKAGEVTGAVKELNAMHGFNAPIKMSHDGTLDLNWSISFVTPDEG